MEDRNERGNGGEKMEGWRWIELFFWHVMHDKVEYGTSDGQSRGLVQLIWPIDLLQIQWLIDRELFPFFVHFVHTTSVNPKVFIFLSTVQLSLLYSSSPLLILCIFLLSLDLIDLHFFCPLSSPVNFKGVIALL